MVTTPRNIHISNLLNCPRHDKPLYFLLFQIVEQRYRKMLTTVTQSHRTGPRGGQLLQLESQRERKLHQEHSNPGQRKSGSDVKAGTLLGIYFTKNLSSQ